MAAFGNHDQRRQEKQNEQPGKDEPPQHADDKGHQKDQLVATFVEQGG